MSINCFDNLTDGPTRLLYEEHPRVSYSLSFDERQEIVIEGDENSVVLDSIRQLVAIWVAQGVFASGSMDLPSSTIKAISDRHPDPDEGEREWNERERRETTEGSLTEQAPQGRGAQRRSRDVERPRAFEVSCTVDRSSVPVSDRSNAAPR